MSRFHRFHALAVASTLQLSLLAGCATPIATGPVTPAIAPPGADAAPSSPATPASPIAEAPATPAAITRLTGVATFRGEPLAGYALSVYDAATGEPLALASDLVTDAAGRFTLSLANVGTGRTLRVVAHAGIGAVETLVTGTGKALGAAPVAQRRVLAGEAVQLNELTTALSRIARGLVANAAVLNPVAAEEASDRALDALMAIAPALQAAFASSPATANRLVETRDPARLGAEEAAHVTNLVRAANVIREATQLVAEQIAAIARQAETSENAAPLDDARKAALAKLDLAGTVLASSLDAQGRLVLTNTLTGMTRSASAADLSGVTATVTASSGGGSSAPAPAMPTLTAISQARGSVGTIVTLTGTNFSATAGDNVVTFGAVTAAAPISASSTTLRVLVPAGLPVSTTPVTVTVETAGRATETGQAFEVVARGTVLKDITVGQKPHSLAFDSADNLYVAFWDGSRVKRYHNGVENGDYSTAAHPYTLVVDRQDVAWVATDTNITRIVNGVAAEAVAGFHGHMAVDADNYVWSGKQNTRTVSKLRWNADTSTLESSSIRGAEMPRGDDQHWTGIAVSGTTVWLGANNLIDMYRISPDEDRLEFWPRVANMVTGLDGTVWIAGLNRFCLIPWTDAEGFGREIPLTHWAHGLAVGKDGAIWTAQRYANLIGRSVPGAATETFTGFSEVGSLAVDSSGNIWAATIGDGRLVQLAP